MMRQVIYARSVARLCCSVGTALNSLCEPTSVAACARRTRTPAPLFMPAGGMRVGSKPGAGVETGLSSPGTPFLGW